MSLWASFTFVHHRQFDKLLICTKISFHSDSSFRVAKMFISEPVSNSFWVISSLLTSDFCLYSSWDSSSWARFALLNFHNHDFCIPGVPKSCSGFWKILKKLIFLCKSSIYFFSSCIKDQLSLGCYKNHAKQCEQFGNDSLKPHILSHKLQKTT